MCFVDHICYTLTYLMTLYWVVKIRLAPLEFRKLQSICDQNYRKEFLQICHPTFGLWAIIIISGKRAVLDICSNLVTRILGSLMMHAATLTYKLNSHVLFISSVYKRGMIQLYKKRNINIEFCTSYSMETGNSRML